MQIQILTNTSSRLAVAVRLNKDEVCLTSLWLPRKTIYTNTNTQKYIIEHVSAWIKIKYFCMLHCFIPKR